MYQLIKRITLDCFLTRNKSFAKINVAEKNLAKTNAKKKPW